MQLPFMRWAPDWLQPGTVHADLLGIASALIARRMRQTAVEAPGEHVMKAS